MSSQNAEPPARPPFQTGVPGWLSFDNKYKGGGVLEAAVQAILQVRPLPPYLSFQVWGSWVFFRVARVCRTNVKQAERSGKMLNCHREATGFVVKQEHSFTLVNG